MLIKSVNKRRILKMFRKHSKVISVILSLTLIATMCVMSATSFSAADTGFYVVGEMQGWAPLPQTL